MSNAKFVVLYPQPTDPDTLEKAYAHEHIPLMQEKIKGMKAVVTKMQGTPAEPVPHFYMVEIYAPRSTRSRTSSTLRTAGKSRPTPRRSRPAGRRP